jgi:hypothetical protein
VTQLAAKILLAPLCVVAVSLAGRRWGVAVAGLLGGLPVVAGPILLVETLLHGPGFGADAAAGTLLGLAALTAFVRRARGRPARVRDRRRLRPGDGGGAHRAGDDVPPALAPILDLGNTLETAAIPRPLLAG